LLEQYSRHKRFVRDYIRFYGNSQPKTARVGKTELDILQENHRYVCIDNVLNGVSQTLTITYRFVREADENDTEISWEQRIAKRYYEKLFKEYAICDLKQYKEGRIAMRWRTENEVVVGKGMLT
jgi:protein FRA10AC1